MAFEPGANIPPIKTYPDKFVGHVVVVTGAAQGIGEVTAKLFAAQGAQVVLVDIQHEKIKKVQSEIEESGGKAISHICDICDEEAVSRAVKHWIESLGKIDVLVNLAGIYPFIPFAGYPTEDYRRVMSLNVDACFFLIRAILPYMQKAGYGRIVNTSSTTIDGPEPGLSMYVASKSAVIGLTRSVAVEAGPGVTSNAVMPGYIHTETTWNQHVRPDGTHPLFETLVHRQAVKRRGRPEDIAHTICFIASPEAQFITGQAINVSGGLTFH